MSFCKFPCKHPNLYLVDGLKLAPLWPHMRLTTRFTTPGPISPPRSEQRGTCLRGLCMCPHWQVYRFAQVCFMTRCQCEARAGKGLLYTIKLELSTHCISLSGRERDCHALYVCLACLACQAPGPRRRSTLRFPKQPCSFLTPMAWL